MKTRNWTRLSIVLALVVIGLVVTLATSITAAQEEGVLAFDVAENGTRFVFQQEPVLENGYPAYGNPFLTQGYLYPAGTLDDSNGVLENGDPEFPDLVLGRWVCRGWIFADEGAVAESGVLVVTTQIYDLNEMAGAESLMTEGFELAEFNPIQRAITGGTGQYAGASGEQTQTVLGFNASQGVNLHVEFRLADPGM